MKNPFVEIRSELGLTLAQMASAAGVSPSGWVAAEQGNIRNPRRILAGIEGLGYDPIAVYRRYERWRIGHLAASREDVLASRSA